MKRYVSLALAGAIVLFGILSVWNKDASNIAIGAYTLTLQLFLTAMFVVVNYKVRWYKPVLVSWIGAAVPVLIYTAVLGHPLEFQEGTFKVMLSLYPAFVGIFTGLMTAAIALFWKEWGEGFVGANENVCSGCGKTSETYYSFCPYCGEKK